MFKTWPKFYLSLILFFFVGNTAFAQQDMEFHLTNTFLPGKAILKVKRDYYDPYLWVLTKNSEVYRINSETLVVDNYTSKFAAFNNLPFIDIAGNSKDEVFIAQADKVIRYKNGTISTITNADGLIGTVKTVYFDLYLYNSYDNEMNPLISPVLLITTSTGTNQYFTGSNRYYHNGMEANDVTVSTYKRTMYIEPEPNLNYYHPEELAHKALSRVYETQYLSYIFLNPNKFGSQLKASYYNGGFNRYGSGFSYLGNVYWATEKGLIQIWYASPQNQDLLSRRYLSGKNISQISSIYGLTSLGYANIRENLLVATDEGLYFSNSKLSPEQYFPEYQFYHYDGLGNKKINYIDVNAYQTSNEPNIGMDLIVNYCENGVWVGAEDGLYLIRPDYKNYFDENQIVQSIAFSDHGFDETSLQICPGQTAKAFVYINTSGHVQWYKNGQELANQSEKTLEINSAGEYYAIIYDPCNDLRVQTNHLTISYLDGTAVPFNYPDKMNYCYGSTATLSVPDNPDFQYRWYRNGVLNGITTPSIDITENGNYKLEVNSCAGTWVATKEVEISFIQLPKPTITSAKTTICAGSEALLTASVAINATDIKNWQAYTYKWYKDGELLSKTTTDIKVSEAGKYTVEITACEGNSNTSDALNLKVIDLPNPQISTLKDVFCEGETATINTNVLVDPSYTINWFKDGMQMPGNTNKTFIETTAAGSYYYCLTSNVTALTCSKNSTTKSITFVPGPAFTFNYSGLITKCAGESVSLNISGSTSYKYRWYRNGVLNGEVTNTLPITTSGKYKGEVSVCENSWVPTTEVEVKFTQLPVPVIMSNKNGYCIGDNAQLLVNVPLDPSYTINWYRDGNIVSEWQNQTSVQTNISGNYVVKILSSAPVCEQPSAPKSIVFEAKPDIHIETIVKTTLCEGETIDLKINLTGGTVKWSTGETSAIISVKHSGIYKVVYTSAGGCETDAQTELTLYPKPVLNLFNQAICAFKKEVLTLTAPAGYKSYSWNNGESTSSTFDVSKPQTVSLAVTDFNNCTATQSIQIRNQCPDLHFANTFTPNGDGVNDRWVITGLEDDSTVIVRVFNRAGIQVFESKGYQNAWDGTYNGKRLSAGVYYYVITTKSSSEILKGALTILY